jgi:hypothetical protein
MTVKKMTSHLEAGKKKDAAKLSAAECEALKACLRVYWEAFQRIDNPGFSDLNNDQPVHISVPLGHLRATEKLLR